MLGQNHWIPGFERKHTGHQLYTSVMHGMHIGKSSPAIFVLDVLQIMPSKKQVLKLMHTINGIITRKAM